jgi:hypothetical protein
MDIWDSQLFMATTQITGQLVFLWINDMASPSQSHQTENPSCLPYAHTSTVKGFPGMSAKTRVANRSLP